MKTFTDKERQNLLSTWFKIGKTRRGELLNRHYPNQNSTLTYEQLEVMLKDIVVISNETV